VSGVREASGKSSIPVGAKEVGKETEAQPVQRPWGRMESGMMAAQRGGLCGWSTRREGEAGR
jgi:hypothetical protein